MLKHSQSAKLYFIAVLLAFNLLFVMPPPYKTVLTAPDAAAAATEKGGQGPALSYLNQSAAGSDDDGDKVDDYGNGSSPNPASFNASYPQSPFVPDFGFDNAGRHYINNISDSNPNAKPISAEDYDRLKNCSADTSKRPSSLEYLTYFNCGRVKVDTLPEGKQQVTREFTLVAEENQSIPIAYNGLKFENSWTFNGTIPGPTMRVTEGDLVKITVVNSMGNNHSHSIHLHSIHSGDMDGIEGKGGAIPPGQNYTYSFVAQPYGVYPYHCHVTPIDQHINRGLYGVFIIDPPTPRPLMREMVMLMNGYDLDYEKEGIGPNRIPTPEEVEEDFMPQPFEHVNEVYSVNGKAFDYMNHPIHLDKGVPYRVYLVNMLEFDPVNNFHLHGNVFKYYPSGTSETPAFVNDIVALTQGDRGILEFKYDLPGKYMFHSHINEFTDLGWMGFFEVR
jgi:FtsP/CotA-like multicopper oxidase with cupredoxin domain